MAKTKISEFSATPANNTDIDSINIAEGCSPSGINDAIRELMAQLKDFQTGAVGDSFNGPVGTTTAAAGAFTTLSASSTVSGTGFSTYLASPPAIGGTAAAAGSFTTLSASGNVTLSGGTANGVAYLNGSKVVTSGSALTFDGTTFTSTAPTTNFSGANFAMQMGTAATYGYIGNSNSQSYLQINGSSNGTPNVMIFGVASSEQMRLTSTGLGIGTSSPTTKLSITDSSGPIIRMVRTSNRFEVSADTDFMSLNARDASTYITFKTADTERARIDSSGRFAINVAGNSYSQDAGLTVNGTGFTRAIYTNINGTSSATHCSFANGNGVVGSITTSGSATLYNVTSDQRLKENIQDADSASALIDSLKVRKFDWKSDSTHQRYGFVAQELVDVAPETVHQPVDTDEMMSVDYSKLVPMLVKEIQSLRKRLADAGIA